MQDDNFQGTDPLEPKDDLFNPDTDEEKLENDFESPAAPAQDVSNEGMPDTFPETDTNIDAHEKYDEGLAGAAEVNLKPEQGPQVFPLDDQDK